MLNKIVTALVIGLLVMGVLHLLGSTSGISLLNLLVSALVLGFVIMVVMHFLRSI